MADQSKMKMPDQYWTGNPLFKERLPWLTPGAIEVLEKIVQPDFDVLEFGAGGSTLYFSDHCRSLVTWEDNVGWMNKIKPMIRHPDRVSINTDLAKVLNIGRTFDIVLVDSEGIRTDRQAISLRALPMVDVGGWFILDNYGRYKTDFLKGWKIETFDDPHWSGRGTLIAKNETPH